MATNWIGRWVVGSVLMTALGGMVHADQHRRDGARNPTLPVFSGMRAELEAHYEALADPQIADKLARFTRNYFEALKRHGFSEAQALDIVKAVGFPGRPGGRR
ncbi:MAG: hypothetical protein AAF493_23640 [Pseudomonadota bacterium]